MFNSPYQRPLNFGIRQETANRISDSLVLPTAHPRCKKTAHQDAPCSEEFLRVQQTARYLPRIGIRVNCLLSIRTLLVVRRVIGATIVSLALLLCSTSRVFSSSQTDKATEDSEYWAALDSDLCKDLEGKHSKPTANEIRNFLAAHEIWLEWGKTPPSPSGDQHGTRLNLRGADLRGVDLSGQDLRGANFRCADLRRAKLTHANLGVVVVRTFSSGPSLYNASFEGSDLRGADLEGAELTGALLRRARIGVTGRAPRLVYIENIGGFVASKESDCSENEINSGLAPAWTKMKSAKLTDADLLEAYFDVDYESLPDTISFAGAQNVQSLRSCEAPFALTVMREQLKKTGFVDQARALTYAIRHQERLREKGLSRYVSYVLFEGPSEWGMSPSRPLKLLFVIICLSAAFYARALNPESSGRLWLTFPADSIEKYGSATAPERLTLAWRNAGTEVKLIGRWLRRPRQLFIAMAFSLSSAFSIGWHDLNLGAWLTRIWGREYVIRATGWVRTISGIQSVVSMYLVALWVLAYFGSPFDY
jgi:uncharacterized protein YjbI with pentapeptide repeats